MNCTGTNNAASIKLVWVKLLHTAIWVFFNVVIFYLLYAVIADKIDTWAWICFGLIGIETLILLIFKRVCPVTLLAKRYSDSDRANFDIYLPHWLAKHNQLIYSIIVVIAILIFSYRLLT